MPDVLGTDRAELYARRGPAPTAEARRFGRALCRRCTGTPAAAPHGRAGRSASSSSPSGRACSSPGPRPRSSSSVRSRRSRTSTRRSWSMSGTGTGAIALAISDERPGRTCARDRPLARGRRARRATTRARSASTSGRAGDLLDALPAPLRGPVDLVVSNPPYVSRRSSRRPPRGGAGRPARSPAAVEIYERLFAQARRSPAAGGGVVVEIEESTGAEVAAAASAAGFADVEVSPTSPDATAWSPARTTGREPRTRSTRPWPPPAGRADRAPDRHRVRDRRRRRRPRRHGRPVRREGPAARPHAAGARPRPRASPRARGVRRPRRARSPPRSGPARSRSSLPRTRRRAAVGPRRRRRHDRRPRARAPARARRAPAAGPLAVTSANRSGDPPARTCDELVRGVRRSASPCTCARTSRSRARRRRWSIWRTARHGSCAPARRTRSRIAELLGERAPLLDSPPP